MGARDQKLVEEIRADALSDTASLAGALRKCIALGADTGSQELRDWASQELKGYVGFDNVPEYRRVPAQIQIDGVTPGAIVKQQPIAFSQLPDVVRDKISEQLAFTQGAGELEALAARARTSDEPLKFSLPGGSDIARIMTAEAPWGVDIQSVYWSVPPPVVEGVLDQLRTSLTVLVAELRAGSSPGHDIPASAADQAVQFVITGKRNKVNVVAPVTSGGSTTNVQAAQPRDDSGWWTTSRKLGALIVGLATIAGATATVLSVL